MDKVITCPVCGKAKLYNHRCDSLDCDDCDLRRTCGYDFQNESLMVCLNCDCVWDESQRQPPAVAGEDGE